MAGIFDFLFGTQNKLKRLPTQNPMQMQLMQQIFGGLQGNNSNFTGLNYLNDLFSDEPGAFSSYEAPLLRQFNEQILPSIAERFGGMGSGAKYSTGLNNSLATAGQRLSEGLGAQRAGLRQNSFGNILGLLGSQMQPSFENLYTQGQPGLLQNLGSGLGQVGSLYGLKQFGL